MRKSDFYYELPEALIAQEPSGERSASRLLVLDGEATEDRRFAELPELLGPGDLLVFNDTRVIPARLHGEKQTGGRVEVVVERLLGGSDVLALVRASKPPRRGQRLHLGPVSVEVLGRRGDLFELRFPANEPVVALLERIGTTPLPPYITRPAEPRDRERYQTVYARRAGAAAAPTAGLHFTPELMQQLERRGVERAFLTLHVGAGTFAPVRVEELHEHRMHAEVFEIGAETAEAVNRARREGRRVIAVGTTVVRALESAAGAGGRIEPFSGETDIFIYPGHRFRTVDALITNFHLPESTLLMLVCAFAGTGRVLAAYRHAVEKEYRFFSYGDAMFIGSVASSK